MIGSAKYMEAGYNAQLKSVVMLKNQDNLISESDGTIETVYISGVSETVAAQYEDVGRDMECYVDEDGNACDFAFDLNWSGVIQDERVETYYWLPKSILRFSGAFKACRKIQNIIESGNHEELLNQGGFYAELYNSQFEQAS